MLLQLDMRTREKPLLHNNQVNMEVAIKTDVFPIINNIPMLIILEVAIGLDNV